MIYAAKYETCANLLDSYEDLFPYLKHLLRCIMLLEFVKHLYLEVNENNLILTSA